VSAGSADGDIADRVTDDGAISADGNLVAFASSDRLTPDDPELLDDVYLRDRAAGTIELVSIAPDGVDLAGWRCRLPSLSGDGGKVVFSCSSPGTIVDPDGVTWVFVRDRAAGTTSIVTQQDTGPTQSTISADGRRVVFETRDASDPRDTNSAEDVLVRDLVTSTTARVSITTAGAAGNNDSFDPDISDDGRFVAFASVASNFVAGDDFGSSDVFVHDRDSDGDGVFDEPGARTTTLADITAAGGRAGQSLEPALSGDGRLVAFTSDAGGVVPGDTNFARDAFVRDRASGTTTLVSADAVGTVGSDRSTSPLLSGDGHYVVFRSDASNLVSGDRNRTGDVFITSAVRPAVAGVAPGSVARGATVTVRITGTGFLDDATVAVSGTGVTVRRVMATATAITARVTVATTAAPGERSVTVTNPGTGPGDSGADARCGGCLTIT
jgi:dipeptidyl aminopeptidase/acylaminoacyl peptidase